MSKAILPFNLLLSLLSKTGRISFVAIVTFVVALVTWSDLIAIWLADAEIKPFVSEFRFGAVLKYADFFITYYAILCTKEYKNQRAN